MANHTRRGEHAELFMMSWDNSTSLSMSKNQSCNHEFVVEYHVFLLCHADF